MSVSAESAERTPSFVERVCSRLSRVSSTGRFLPEIDGLRFVAIGSVLLYHLMPTFAIKSGQAMGDRGFLLELLARGDFGVRLFFAISGFILALPFAEAHLRGRPPPTLGRYFTRRLTRIEPPYLLALAVMFVAAVAMHRATAGSLFPHLVASTFYLHNQLFGAVSLVNGVAWSLEVEVQFYVLAPLLAQVFRLRPAGRRRALLAGAIVALTAVNVVTRLYDPSETWLRWYLALPYHLPYFLAGFLLADLHVGRGADAPPSWRWDALGIAGWLLLAVVLVAVPPNMNGTLAPLVFLAYLGTLRGRALGWLFSRRAIVTVGGMCYTIYLYHYPMLSTLGRLTFRLSRPDWPFALNFVVQVLVLVPLVLAACAVLFALTERPFMRPDWWPRVAGALRRRRQKPVLDAAP